MKTTQIIFSAASLALLLVATTAFINIRYDKERKNVQQPTAGNGFAVVELFTSEGCSSCPPADALLEKLEKENQNKQLYILAYHVDYWDHQGWKDTFSDHDFSLRQGQYANWMNLQTVYTPQLVVNGSAEMIGSEQGKVLRAIAAGMEQTTAPSLKLSYELKDGKALVGYDGIENGKRSELVLALVQKSAQSNVKAGENAGRALSHVQIVRQLVRADINDKKTIALSLPKDFNEKGWELIGFVQDQQNGHITSAASIDFDQQQAGSNERKPAAT